MSPPRPPSIWLLDDTQHWHDVSHATVHEWGASFQGFYTSTGLLSALTHTSQDAFPLCILMDFYIGNERGDLVTATITEKIDANLIILGYSTASYGSQAIVAQGGYDMVRKHNNARGINPSLLEWLKTAGNRLLA